MKMDPYFIPYININSKWIKHLTIQAKTIKLSEETIDIKPLDYIAMDFQI